MEAARGNTEALVTKDTHAIEATVKETPAKDKKRAEATFLSEVEQSIPNTMTMQMRR